MEDAFHCNSDALAVGVNGSWVLHSVGWVERSSGG